jgi:hypothetical protein
MLESIGIDFYTSGIFEAIKAGLPTWWSILERELYIIVVVCILGILLIYLKKKKSPAKIENNDYQPQQHSIIPQLVLNSEPMDKAIMEKMAAALGRRTRINP